ncbi:hypothetical protein AHFPHNDE_03051 [Pseudomonas sp. MM227]|nr:hypothetical protein AHFPHNDE_03051 [Pseudomonas sp. MM227]
MKPFGQYPPDSAPRMPTPAMVVKRLHGQSPRRRQDYR